LSYIAEECKKKNDMSDKLRYWVMIIIAVNLILYIIRKGTWKENKKKKKKKRKKKVSAATKGESKDNG